MTIVRKILARVLQLRARLRRRDAAAAFPRSASGIAAPAFEQATPADDGRGPGSQPPVESMPPDARPVKRDGVDDALMLDGTAVLYSWRSDEAMTLNPTAALIWEYCDGEHTVRAMVAELLDVFPDRETAEAGVSQVLDSLLRGGMIVAAPPPESSADRAERATEKRLTDGSSPDRPISEL